MKQVLQDLKSGKTKVLDVPTPRSRAGYLLIATQNSLIASGTERMLIEFGRANLIQKARSQPDRLRQAWYKVQNDGPISTYDAVRARLNEPLPLGYSNAGVVVGVGHGVTGFDVGDRVASNGYHAEVVSVPQNLCAHVPDNVTYPEAAFTVMGAIGLQGIRLVAPTLGETIVVFGLGLVGLLSVQMLIANGCRVVGIDLKHERLELARQFGAEVLSLNKVSNPVQVAKSYSAGSGVDAVLVTAFTKSHKLMHQAAEMCRKRGRIVLVGVTGLNLSRADFYEKELTFQVSCSYGPGRYDPGYEEKGHDYPFGFVRWTAQRNFEAVLAMMADGKLNVTPLISHRYPLAEASQAYQRLTEDGDALGILFAYPEIDTDLRRTLPITNPDVQTTTADADATLCGVLGAGNFAERILLPALARTDAQLHTIASSGGTSAAVVGRKFQFDNATSDSEALLEDETVNTVFILTRHNSHARLTAAALKAGKHVFVEKPLALNRDELAQIEKAIQLQPDRQLLVGFNRRFSPLARQMKELLRQRTEPLSIVYTVNAGDIPAEHWTQDPSVGGGRIIGEACHFIDFLRFLVGAPIAGIKSNMMGGTTSVREDKMSILLDFADGSIGTVHYLANGSKQFPKERVELFSQGRVLVLDNYRSLKGYGWRGFRRKWLWRQDKGHRAEVSAFIERISEGGDWLIPWDELKEVTLASFVALEQARSQPAPLE